MNGHYLLRITRRKAFSIGPIGTASSARFDTLLVQSNSASSSLQSYRFKSTFTHRTPPSRGRESGTNPSTTHSSIIQRTPVAAPALPPHQHAPPPSHFAPQPPPHTGAPRLIRHPPIAEAAQPPPPPPAPPSALFQYTRGPSSRLFSFHNSATSASTTTSYAYKAGPSSELTIDQVPTMPGEQEADKVLRNRKPETNTTTANSKSSVVEHPHEHHSHGWLGGHSHSHSHAAEGSAEEADKLLKALKGKGDRGSNITVVGLIANLVLCGAKGLAGVWLHSASLLADAAHSLSDTFSDLVTLFCWKMSQRPASQSHPLGYGKFETMGGLGVSVVLVAGAFAIGMHSYGLLLDVLQPHMHQMPSGLQAFGHLTGDLARAAGGLLHDHHHTAVAAGADAGSNTAGAILNAADGAKTNLSGAETENLLDPNAMWFALISVLVKEWLYHATLKIAREEKSSVLEANAIHHRSDSLSSGVTFLAIGGSYMGFPVLDPLGGLLVAGLIGKQGIELLINALADLSDRGVQPEVLDDFERALQAIVDGVDDIEGPAAAAGKRTGVANHTTAELEGSDARLLGWKDLRAVRSGVSTFVDVTLIMREDVQLKQARIVEQKVREKLISAVKGVKEVRIHLDTQHEN
ncbi:hypothetical protein L7F22_043854 [Adiantum nelumboides]|nr:hypothetical protein [Adiantum nelumboides]